jgi:integrase
MTDLPRYSINARDGAWHVLWRVNGRQLKRKIGPVHERGRPAPGALNRSEADRAAREVVAADVPAPRSGTSGPTFRDVAADYLEYVERVRGARPSTMADHRLMLGEPGIARKRGEGTTNGHIMAALGDREAGAITRADVERVLDTVEGSGSGPRTVNKYLALTRAVLNHGVRRMGLARNPADGIDKRREPQRAALDTYSAAEVEQVADAMPDAQDAELIRVAAYTGLRQGELLALRWSDVGVDVLTVSRALSAGVETGTKSGRIRHVPLVPRAAKALDRLRERGDFTADTELVFPNWRGQHGDGGAVSDRYKKARDAAGLRPLRFHDLRHTFGSLLAAGGVSVVEIQAAMGHADLATTARYLHARQASEQVNRFAAALS